MRLLGDEALKRTIFVTTQWPDPSEGEPYDDAVDRENELSTSDLFLKPFIQKGASVQRFLGTQESAQNIIDAILPATRIPLQIQPELVDQNLGLQSTQAGQLIAASVEDMIEFYMLGIAELQEIIKSLKDAKDQSSVEKRRAEEDRLKFYLAMLENTKRDRKILAMNLWKKLRRNILRVFRFTVQDK